jgi:hypothetical protein
MCQPAVEAVDGDDERDVAVELEIVDRRPRLVEAP